MKYRIGFNRTSLQGNELEYISQAVASGEVAGDQTFSKKCQALLESDLGVARVLVTSSCTHALEMAALLLDIGQGDEVVMPSYTFVSTANAFVLRGARPVFCDIRPDRLNIDEHKLESLVTKRTKAIVPPSARTAFMEFLKARGIHAVFHYQPLHSSVYATQLGGVAEDCPVTDRVSESLVRLPLHTAMSDADQQEVIDAVQSFGH